VCCGGSSAAGGAGVTGAAAGQGRAGFSPLGLGPSAFARGGAGVLP